MTKKVRVENADTSDFKIVVEVWDKGNPDSLVKSIDLDYPTAMVDDVYIHNDRYLVIKEKK